MRIIITGAAGTLGSALCRHYCKDHEVIAVDTNETALHYLSLDLPIDPIVEDICNAGFWWSQYADVVINCAAMKHVVTCEANPFRALEVNAHALINMRGDWRLLQISTDKAVYPINAYGFSKYIGEQIALAYGSVIRLVNIHNSRGCAEEIWAEKCRTGKTIVIRGKDTRRHYITLQRAVLEVNTAVNVLTDTEYRIAGDSYLFQVLDPPCYKMRDIAHEVMKNHGYTSVEYAPLMDGEKEVEDLAYPIGWESGFKQGEYLLDAMNVIDFRHRPSFYALMEKYAPMREHG